ncbi:MAG: phosphoribosylglycinamide formyltransferase [Crocinitomicaceae bacterium]|nr:phosphoribosylglycinamide formyltransferase [Crocinitomicaceae bacterium]|tara:strand:- start:62989 stop:63561 length:573 start_codon:yes stop_codon:yes gene_type:complete
MGKIKIAIFASGKGSNAINLISFFKNHNLIEVSFVLSNKADAPVLNSVKKIGLETKYYNKNKIEDGEFLTQVCKTAEIDWIILAGYLKLIPPKVVLTYKDKIINVHPSLLPKYGGKGMYGLNVHKEVLKNKEKESGITIHFVNEQFDKGRIIAQFYFEINPKDNLLEIERKIKQLEQKYLPIVIEKSILQ